jgi:hypothetical protein
MGGNDLPPAIRFHPDIGEAIMIFIRLAFGNALLVICTSHGSHVSVDPYPEIR